MSYDHRRKRSRRRHGRSRMTLSGVVDFLDLVGGYVLNLWSLRMSFLRRCHGPPRRHRHLMAGGSAAFVVAMVLTVPQQMTKGEQGPPGEKKVASSRNVAGNLSLSAISRTISQPEQEKAESEAPSYSPPGSKTFTMKCAPGSDDLRVYTGYLKHVPTLMRLCALPIPSWSQESKPGDPFYVRGAKGRVIASAPASYNFMGLIRAARKSGIQLSATSSFRTMAHQTSLWNGSDKTGVWVASPGGSPHQQGGAIDFYFQGVNNTGASCIYRGGVCTRRGHRVWDWLNKNASKYGVHQYTGEFWHFNAF